MGPRRGDPHQTVPGADTLPFNNVLPVHDPHGKTRDVVDTVAIETGHLRGFPAQEGHPRFPAAPDHSPDQQGRHIGVQLAAGQVVQKEQGPGPVAEYVIGAHGYAVNSHGVVLFHPKGHVELGAHAVGPGNEYRLFHAGPGWTGFPHFSAPQAEHPREAPDAVQNLRPGKRRGKFPVLFHRPVPFLDVHPRLFVIHFPPRYKRFS